MPAEPNTSEILGDVLNNLRRPSDVQVRKALRALRVDEGRRQRAAAAMDHLPGGFTVALQEGQWAASGPITLGPGDSSSSAVINQAAGTTVDWVAGGTSDTAVTVDAGAFQFAWQRLEPAQRDVAVHVANQWMYQLQSAPAGDVVYNVVASGVAQAARLADGLTDEAVQGGVRELIDELNELSGLLRQHLDHNQHQGIRATWLRIAAVVAMLLIASTMGLAAATGGQAVANAIGIAVAVYMALASIDPKTGRPRD